MAAGLASEAAACAEAWNRVRAVEDQHASLQGDGDTLREQTDLLAYRNREIEAAAPDPADHESLLE